MYWDVDDDFGNVGGDIDYVGVYVIVMGLGGVYVVDL